MPHEVIMPALGMAQDTGLIVSWLRQPGDAIKTGDALMEVETDKAVMEVEAQADGFLTSVTAAAGDHVPVGQVVALITDTAEASAATPQQPTASIVEPEGDLPEGKNIIMPALGMAQDTGLIVAWRKKAGDPVAATDVLFEVETDKSVMEVEAGHDGYLAAVLADAQQAVPVGSVIAIISTDKPAKAITRSAAPAPAEGAPRSKSETPEPGPAPLATVSASTPTRTVPPLSATSRADANGRILASPKTRRLALEQGLDLGRLVTHGVPQPFHVADLETFRTLGAEPASAPQSPAPATSKPPVPLHIAARMAANGCDGFIAWMADDGNIDLQPQLLWLRFATAALRQATAQENDQLVIETGTLGNTDGRFRDPDRSRLSQPDADNGDQPPSLVIRDLTGSPVISVTASIAHAPVLSIGREQDTYVISLDYHAGHFDEDQAIDFVTGFAERLGDPLHYLV